MRLLISDMLWDQHVHSSFWCQQKSSLSQECISLDSPNRHSGYPHPKWYLEGQINVNNWTRGQKIIMAYICVALHKLDKFLKALHCSLYTFTPYSVVSAFATTAAQGYKGRETANVLHWSLQLTPFSHTLHTNRQGRWSFFCRKTHQCWINLILQPPSNDNSLYHLSHCQPLRQAVDSVLTFAFIGICVGVAFCLACFPSKQAPKVWSDLMFSIFFNSVALGTLLNESLLSFVDVSRHFLLVTSTKTKSDYLKSNQYSTKC